MSEPQYSDFGSEIPDVGYEPTRVSVLAISSLITGILSFIGCCLPAVGILPLALGIGALAVIQRSMGRVAGRGLAIGGIILGLLALVLSTGLWVGAASIGGKFGPVYGQGLDPDPTVVRSVLTSSAAAKLTDERVAEFQEGLVEAYGEQARIPGGLLPLYRAYENLDPNALQSLPRSPGSQIFPLPANAAGGWFPALMVPTRGGERVDTWLPRLEDVGYVAPDGSIVWLLKGDAAGRFAPEPKRSAPADR